MRAFGAREAGGTRASCWMLVLATTRHALWVDYHVPGVDDLD